MPKLKLLARGKVRDIYALPEEKDADKLLFVATDRISAFDIIMDNVRLRTLSVDKADGIGHSQEGSHPHYPLQFLVRQIVPHHPKPRYPTFLPNCRLVRIPPFTR
jgi:hypothetical protein